MSQVEDIILDRDKRGVSHLRGYLSPDFCHDAARFLLEHAPRALICTGFYIKRAKAPETDGPPGAYFIGKALQALGFQVTYVSDRHSIGLFRGLARPHELIEFPIADVATSRRFAQDVLSRLTPTVVISIERCSLTARGRYLNMLGVDITPFNARLDYLVEGQPATIGIGDGGNEIGMGNLAAQIPSVATLPKEPAATTVSKLVLASVSNWGGYGLITALSLQARRNLLPSVETETDLIRFMVSRGAVDGIMTQRVHAVDGFLLEENQKTLERLHALLSAQGLRTG
ncbi:MAG: DUF4392 domain-containing protein [Chloroflexi bacterium]|nr:DUF4392 domain-containing protein [Chloroflexota bacterium]